LGVLGAGALGTGVVAKDTLGFVTTRHTVPMRGLTSSLRVVQLTDLHYGAYVFEDWVRRWVNAANLERADLIVVTGDIVDHRVTAAQMDSLVAELARLEARLGVYAVLGNHDYWYVTPDDSVLGLQTRLERSGIRVLMNEAERPRDDLYLAGIDDLWNGQPDLERSLNGLTSSAASLLLSHNPDILAKVPSSVGLTLSGHTHGGQVRIPGMRTIFNVSNYGERFQRGWVTGFTGARGYVSRGLGVGGLPVRMFCPAELAVFDLEPA
jgi:predicted MPP superfamily phosphohydrolase